MYFDQWYSIPYIFAFVKFFKRGLKMRITLAFIFNFFPMRFSLSNFDKRKKSEGAIYIIRCMRDQIYTDRIIFYDGFNYGKCGLVILVKNIFLRLVWGLSPVVDPEFWWGRGVVNLYVVNTNYVLNTYFKRKPN